MSGQASIALGRHALHGPRDFGSFEVHEHERTVQAAALLHGPVLVRGVVS